MTPEYFYIEHKEMVGILGSPITGLPEYGGTKGLRVFTQKGLLRLTRVLRSDMADILFQAIDIKHLLNSLYNQ